ncbi:unnamed protein product [Paramecium pentaurelia]|uniref:Uncharacterized protein n=1 Tax=Paramecium pentaurelia TaxID=43138 RepID=A0A8S1SL06_9CILI|nr:unnamed protein product [Paramecium pentaurelia]
MNDLMKKTNRASTFQNNQKLASRQIQDTFVSQTILDQNAVERWINEALREACVDEKQNNLKKLGLDRHSLKSAGLKDEEANRLYRSMFVYTVGFYEMLQDILKNFQLTANIWQVFGILLEYVAKGDFQLTINQIKKENSQKIEELNETLTQRENKFRSIEIMAQDEINKLQNILQDLNDQNNLLKLQRDNAELDFQQSNTAFEQEVTLRIKFQYRINEITSVYRELEQNYTKLSEELKELRILYDYTTNDLMKSKKHLECIIAEIDIKDNQIINFNQTIENQKRLLDEKENKILIQELKINKLSQDSIQDHSHYMNYEHQFNQLCMQFSNYKEENIYKLQKLEKYQRNYQDTLEMNKKLTNENQEIKQENVRLQNENKKQKIAIDSFEQLEQGYRSSILQLQQEIRDLIEEHEDEIKKYQKIQVEYQFGIQRISMQQEEILTLNQNIQQMKINKNSLNELLNNEKAENQQLKIVLEGKEETIKDLEKCLRFSQQRLQSHTLEMNEFENKLKQDFKTTEISYQKQIEQLQETIDTQNQDIINEKKKYEELQNKFESQIKELSDVKSLHNVLVFENNELIKKQVFSDNVINNENQRIGQLINEITSIRNKYEESLSKYKKLEIKFDQQQRQIYKDKSFLIDQYTNKIKNYQMMQKDMVHKMKFEDALSLLDRTNQKLITLNQSYKQADEQKKQLKNQNQQLNKEIEELNIKLQQQVNLIQTLYKDYNKSCNNLKIIKFKQLVYFASLKEVNKQLKQKTDNLFLIQNNNEDLKKQLIKLQEENFNQQQLIIRYRISLQGQNQKEDLTNEIQTQRKSQKFKSQNLIQVNSFDDQTAYLKNQVIQQNQSKNLKKSKFQNQIEQTQDKIFQQKQDNYNLPLKQLSKTVDLSQSLIENKQQQQIRKLNNLKIGDGLHEISIENDKNQEKSFFQSRSISVSQGSKSQRNKHQKGQLDFLMRVKKNTLIKNAKIDSKQFSQLFQIAREHYQS